MKILGAIIILAGLFYVAWPAYSAYQLKVALESGDAAGLERGIDFPSVRESLRPAVTARLSESLKGVAKGTPGGDALVEKMSAQTLPKLVDAGLDTLLTPQALIRIHADGKSLKEYIATMKADRPELAGQIGGLVRDLLGKGTAPAPSGEPDAPAAAAPIVPEEKRLGLGNVKSVGLDGPFAITLGVARDANAPDADLEVTMGYTGTGWRVTKLVPRI